MNPTLARKKQNRAEDADTQVVMIAIGRRSGCGTQHLHADHATGVYVYHATHRDIRKWGDYYMRRSYTEIVGLGYRYLPIYLNSNRRNSGLLQHCSRSQAFACE